MLEIGGHRILAWEGGLAFGIAAIWSRSSLTPLASALAWRLGAVDRPGGRRMHDGAIPLLGGLGMLAGTCCAASC